MEIKSTTIYRGKDNYKITVGGTHGDTAISLSLVMEGETSMNAMTTLDKQEAKTLAYLLLAYAESIQE